MALEVREVDTLEEANDFLEEIIDEFIAMWKEMPITKYKNELYGLINCLGEVQACIYYEAKK